MTRKRENYGVYSKQLYAPAYEVVHMKAGGIGLELYSQMKETVTGCSGTFRCKGTIIQADSLKIRFPFICQFPEQLNNKTYPTSK